MKSIPVPRYFIFTLEDSTWVIQRGVDEVQELLTGRDRSHSMLDSTYPITDVELDLLMAQGIVDHYDEAYVWLRDTQHTEGIINMNSLERPLGIATYHYVEIDLPATEVETVQATLKKMGMAERYQVAGRWGKTVILDQNGEPFTKLSMAEDAQILLSPPLQELGVRGMVNSIRFDGGSLFPQMPQSPQKTRPLIHKLTPQMKQPIIVCIDDEEVTHEVVVEVFKTWSVEVLSAYNGRDALSIISDIDPSLIITDLILPDMHGYEIVAHVRNNPDLHHIPMIIISSVNTEVDRYFAFNTGKAVDFVTKPFTGEEIRRKVWRVLSAINPR